MPPKKETLQPALDPIVKLLADKLHTKEKAIWLALFANSRNPDFDEEMRVYLKHIHEESK